jgi:lipopolysaccharide transport system ATP-binding protein
VAIVGQNGAGKSTLLKIITGTMAATEGVVQVKGRVAALLELGMGFHPEFTGRQNAYIAGQLLGFSHEEIRSQMAGIEEFAEIGDYFDKPVRTYSSGMQMRVAFSVATCIRPDVLIVDEALSVGDAYFQQKCFARIREFREQGTTLLFVSHDPSAIVNLCDRAVLLDQGRVLADGIPENVLEYYNALIAKRHSDYLLDHSQVNMEKALKRSGTGEAKVRSIRFLDEGGAPLSILQVGMPVRLEVQVETEADIPQLVLGIQIKDRVGNVVFGTNTWHLKKVLHDVVRGQRLVFEYQLQVNLCPGTYYMSTALVSTDTHLVNNYEWVDNVLIFDVVNVSAPFSIGYAALHPAVRISDSAGHVLLD